MLREVRRFAPHGLDVSHVATELRTRALRVGLHRSRGLTSDYAMLERAAPFLHRSARTGVSIVLEGSARYDEEGRHVLLGPGALVHADPARRGSEAHAAASTVLVLEWSSELVGAARSGAFALTKLDAGALARLAAIAAAFEASPSSGAVVDILDLLRACGLPLEPLTRADVEHEPASEQVQRVADAVARSLSTPDSLPAIDEVADATALHTRTLHRRLSEIAEAYRFSWSHWRSALQQTRMLAALRLLSAAGVTTEMAARLAGYRSPAALCHAFAAAGLPSPGALARAARSDALTSWL